MTPQYTVLKKDLVRLKVPLALWAAAGLHLAITQLAGAPDLSTRDSMQILSLIMFVVLGFVTIAWAIQDDSARDAEAFWRSRPIPPMAMLGAKLVLLIGVFVVVPALCLIVGESVSPGFFRRIDRLPNVMGFLLCAVTASAALAACTRNLGEYLLAGVVIIFLVSFLGPFLQASWYGSKRTVFSLVSSKIWVSTILCGVFGIAILLVQYHLRRTSVSIGLIAFLVVSLSLVHAFWSWRIV